MPAIASWIMARRWAVTSGSLSGIGLNSSARKRFILSSKGRGGLSQLFVDLRHVVIMASLFELNRQVEFHLVVTVGKRVEENVAGLQIVNIGILCGVWALLPAVAQYFKAIGHCGLGTLREQHFKRYPPITEPPTLVFLLNLQLAILGTDYDGSTRPVRHQYFARRETRLAVAPIESDGVGDRGASLEHSLARIPPSERQMSIRLIFLLVSRDPVVGEALCVQSALGKTIIKANINCAIISVTGWQEPYSRLWVRPIFVVTEQRPIGIGQHENGAGVSRRGGEGEKRQDKSQSLKANSDRKSVV